MEAEEHKKWGRPGFIHHVREREVDIGRRDPTTKTTHWFIRSSALPQFWT